MKIENIKVEELCLEDKVNTQGGTIITVPLAMTKAAWYVLKEIGQGIYDGLTGNCENYQVPQNPYVRNK